MRGSELGVHETGGRQVARRSRDAIPGPYRRGEGDRRTPPGPDRLARAFLPGHTDDGGDLMRRRLLLALSAAAFLVYHVRHSLNSPGDDWSSIRVAASMVARGRLDLLYTMSFPHQDQPYADGQKGASLQVRRMCQRKCQVPRGGARTE
jgi:hypothetical protein